MADEQKQNTPEAPKKDILHTPEFEAKEMEKLIARGLQAHGVIGLLTVVGLLLLVAAGLYYNKMDKVRENGRFTYFPAYMEKLIENQVNKDRETYHTRGESYFPVWPETMYNKLRQDIFLLAGAAFLLSLIFTHIAQAKSHRNDLLMYRGLAREIERLRQQVRQLRGETGEGDKDEKPAEETAPSATDTTQEETPKPDASSAE